MGNEEHEEVKDEGNPLALKETADLKKRHVCYVMDTITRASDELYQICVDAEDLSFCQELNLFLQNIIFKFEEMMKLKNSQSDGIDAHGTPECSEIADTSEINIPNDNCDDDHQRTSSSGINVSAPDFIPSRSNLELNFTTSTPNEKQKESDLNEQEVIGHCMEDYHESEHPDEQCELRYFSTFGANANFNNQNFSPNVLPPNVYPIHPTPYQHYTHHYIPQMPPYNLPYPVYSSGITNSNIMGVSQVNPYPHQQPLHSQNYGSNKQTGTWININDKTWRGIRYWNCDVKQIQHLPTLIRMRLHYLIAGTLMDPNTPRMATQIMREEAERANRLRAEATFRPQAEAAARAKPEAAASGRSEAAACHITEAPAVTCPLPRSSSLENNKTSNSFGNCQPQASELDDKVFPKTGSSLENNYESSGGETIMFSQTKEADRTHFPKLSSEQKKKGVNLKLNSSGVTKSYQELYSEIMPSCNLRVKNVEEKGMTFSEVTKITHDGITKLPKPSSDNSILITKTKHVAGKDYSASPAKLFASRKTEVINNIVPTVEEIILPELNKITESERGITASENDHMVQTKHNKMTSSKKVQSEDSEGWKQVRTRSKWRGSFSLKPSHHNKSPNSGSRNNSSDEHFDTKTTLENNFMKLDGFNDSYSNEGRSSNETLDEHLVLQSEESSPELGLYDENVSIDPKEMYSAYMQYLSNVEEEGVFSGSSNLELVLHPEILTGLVKVTENCNNPASLEQITHFVNNDPIRALAFKKKLDNRIRLQEDVKKKNDEKQQLAHEKRLQFLHDKTAKFRGFVQKVEEVKAAQHQLALQRKNKLDLKLRKAEEKRKMHLNIIKRKAHDEEEKLKEIAFINELEAQNRRHDSLALRQEHEERLQCLVEERQRRLEEKAAKEAAVEERRKALEAERQEKLELMKEKRRRKEEFIDRKQQEREQERLVNAREKAREREIRLMARHTAHQATVEELQKKIQQKQEESARRHIESIELIRQKAIEIGIHRNTTDNVPKYLNLYKPDLKGSKEHDKYKLCLKKRLKKIKSRMALRGTNFIEVTHLNIKELTTKESLLEKILKKLQKYEPHKVYLWEPEDCDVVDHYLDEILYFLQEEPSLKTALKDMKAFLFFESVINCFNYATHEKCSVPSLRCILKIITICDLSCIESVEVCLYFLLSNILATLLDSLRFSLQALERPCKSWDLIVELLLRFHALVIDGLSELPETMLITIPDFARRMKDLISYILCSGLVNRLIDLFKPSIIDEKFIYKSLVVPSILFFKRLLSTWFISDDLVNILKSTDLLCTVPLLYEGLMKQITNGGPLPEYCMPTISLFLKLADLDLKVFQDILGAENIALQWRGIASGLMTYCVSRNNSTDLLNSVIKLVGYFAIHNKANQTLLQSGKQPTVLQQLVKLPFQYFCDPEYMHELYPTLISCSYNNSTNRAIVENEIDYNGLEKFMLSDTGQKNKIIQLLLSSNEQEDSMFDLQGSPKRNIHVPD